MLFNPFKRRKEAWAHTQPVPPAPSIPRPVPAAPRRAAPAPAAEPAPLPEVVGEGNTQADWSAWEDSMTSWDSQMHDLAASDRVYVRDSVQSKLDELDPFASVGRNRGR